ncbi:MAG TPA: methyltransferase domain-containing protein [Polyangiales bacterium]|nr:methyltransferase domain-containing protein [Polyangiales bacterium]
MTTREYSIAEALRRGWHVGDRLFDRIYPLPIQAVSARFWTPVAVSLLAADWLREAERYSVLDVGAGAGKFCIVTNLATGCRAHGIEQRPRLVEAARAAAASYGAEVDVVLGTIDSVDPEAFSAFYFYNPFGENHHTDSERLDDAVELSPERCARDLACVESWLDAAATGTCVLTYHGFGGRIPDTYDLVRTRDSESGSLHMWIKHRTGRASGFYLELGELVLSSEQLEKLSKRLTPSCRASVRTLLDRPFG